MTETKPTCATCRFSGEEFSFQERHCRRRAPVWQGRPRPAYPEERMAVFPIVYDDWWCGEFEPRPAVDGNE